MSAPRLSTKRLETILMVLRWTQAGMCDDHELVTHEDEINDAEKCIDAELDRRAAALMALPDTMKATKRKAQEPAP